MDINVATTNEHIRKIEDIIDIQKANGNFNVRQVAFNLPSETDSTVSANLVKSLESGLSHSKSQVPDKIKIKKSRLKRHKSPIPDVISWPSDSDITVLRMKLCLTSNIKEKVGSLIPGDGLHQPDSSSMVNLATLMRQSQPHSKHSINFEEYLLPLTSWGEARGQEVPDITVNEKYGVPDIPPKLEVYPMCSRRSYNTAEICLKHGEIHTDNTTKSKIARFLRLYFCPCCGCLYKMEKMSEDPSTYREKHREQEF